MADFPTLSSDLSHPFVEYKEDSTIKSPFEAGYQQTRPRFTRDRRIFECTYRVLSNVDKETLETFLETVRAGADSFDWTHPKTSIVYEVRFRKYPKFQSIAYNLWTVSFVLEEV